VPLIASVLDARGAPDGGAVDQWQAATLTEALAWGVSAAAGGTDERLLALRARAASAPAQIGTSLTLGPSIT
jgi:hypothetical protein